MVQPEKENLYGRIGELEDLLAQQRQLTAMERARADAFERSARAAWSRVVLRRSGDEPESR